MFSIFKKRVGQVAKSLVGVFSLLATVSLGVSAAEYRLFVNDSVACRNAGVAGDVCLVAVGASTATTSSSVTAATSVTVATSSTSTSGTAAGCVVTSWNQCGNATSNSGSVSSTSVASSSSTSSSSTSSVSSASSVSAPSSSGTVAAGNLDFGSGGANAGPTTYKVALTNTTTAYPFTVRQGSFYGKVGIVPTTTPFPDDGTEVRMWWSKTAGGAPLSGGCAATLGRESALYWDQTGSLGYGCPISNQPATLYLNFKACISDRSDGTCSSSGAKAGSTAPVYIFGRLATS